MTNAKYIRDFVLNHSDYKQDSLVSKVNNKINYLRKSGMIWLAT